MYDTVYLNYTITENPSTLSERVFLNTDNIKVTESVSELHSGHKLDRWTRGELDNLKVTMTSNTISVKGSICKYHFGNNLYTLSMKDTKEAINSISESLGLNMKKASVSRVDWSTNLSTTLPPTLYMPKLGDLSRFNRLENPNSIYYNQSAKRLLFYDKMIEAKKKKGDYHKKTMDALLNLYCIKYTPGCKRRRKYLIYFGISILIENLDLNIKLIENKQLVEVISNKIDLIYKEVKKNEISPKTDYLFKGVERSNLDKTIEKMEKMQKMDNFEKFDKLEKLE